jgi:hypothetical protein
MRRNLADKLCSKCDQPGHRIQGGRWLCVRHYRIGQMIYQAQARDRYVPTVDELAVIIAEAESAGMICPHCRRKMNWLASDDCYSTVATLQHDRSGRLRLLCQGCNSRHRHFPGDTMYDYPPDWHYCSKCLAAKPPECFFRNRTTGRAVPTCKACHSRINKAARPWARARATR